MNYQFLFRRTSQLRVIGRGRLGGLFVVCCLATGAWLLANDWPTFRNTSNGGASSETINLPLTEVWHSTAPQVEENGVVVANGIAYMMSQSGELHAFTVSSGFEVDGFPVQAVQTYGTPAVDVVAGRIYVIAGDRLWGFKLDGTPAFAPINVGSTGLNYSESPVIDGGFVYFQAGGLLQKYNSSGAAQWTSASSGNDTQPAVSGNFVYHNSQSGQIRKYDKLTGAEVTTGGFPISTTGSYASLAVVDGKIFHKADELRVYDATTGAALWHQPDGGNSTYSNSPAVDNGTVYVYGWDSKLYAFDESTGATLAGFPSVALATDGAGNYSSPSVAGDKVFVAAGRTQKLKVLGAAGSAQAGTVLEEHLTFSDDPQGFDLCSPAISDGYVFAMLDGGGLYAFFGGSNPPSGALQINGGADCTTSRDVTLTIDNNDDPDVTQMRISEDPFFGDASFVPYQNTYPFTLSEGFGTKTVYAQLKHKDGGLSNVFSDSINYQETCNESPTPTPTPTPYPPGPVSRYYITAGQQGTAAIVQVATVQRTWTEHHPSSPGQYAIAVLNTVRIMGAFQEGTYTIGSEYTLNGAFTGRDFPFVVENAAFWDGASDGAHNYSVDYNNGGVYRFDSFWGNPTKLFNTAKHYLGITFDTSNHTLWLSQWDNGVIEHRSINGQLLSSFSLPFVKPSCLALDPADGTLWMGSQTNLGTFYQFTQDGTPISTRVYSQLANLNTLGGEFRVGAETGPTPSPTPTPTPGPEGPPPNLRVRVSRAMIHEGNSATFTITSSAPPSHPIDVHFKMSGTAHEGADYTLSAPNHQVPIGTNGGSSASVTLHAIVDHVPENTELATMTLQPSSDYTLTDTTKKATLRIKD